MLTTAIIAFREFLEAFLIIGVFIGISRKLHLKRETEIILALAIGIFLSISLSLATYFFSEYAGKVFTEKNADLLESFLLIFSGIFIAYVVFSLHDIMRTGRGKIFLHAHQKLQSKAFDLSLFLSIIFLVLREGFEIALFTASTSLFSSFKENFAGLFIGLLSSGVFGLLTFLAFIKFSIAKIFKITEYMIVLLGASMTQLGLTKLIDIHLSINLSNFFSFHLQSLPDENTLPGHLLQGFFGIDRDFSLVRLFITVLYIFTVYLLFVKKRIKNTGINNI